MEKGTEDCVTLWVKYCSVEVPYSCPAFIRFPRQGCYYRKIFNPVITIICTEEPSGEGSYHMETNQLICFAKRLADFRRVLVFAERYFRAEYVLIALSVKLLSAMVIVVLSNSLVYCYYVCANKLIICYVLDRIFQSDTF